MKRTRKKAGSWRIVPLPGLDDGTLVAISGQPEPLPGETWLACMRRLVADGKIVLVKNIGVAP